VAGLLVALVWTTVGAPVALAGPPEPRCDPGDRSCDLDADRIPDAVEQAVCGSTTCATGTEDADADGLPDWVEQVASGSTTAVRPDADRDRDGMPDFAERLTCGSSTCAAGREDVDADGVRDWAEVVICGDTTCATGTEDLDGDGVPDHQQLQACVVYDRRSWRDLATTGWAPWALATVAATLLGTGGWLVRRVQVVRSARAAVAAQAAADEPGTEA
jgi:hypothetical protein